MSDRTELALEGVALVATGLSAGFCAGITVAVFPGMMALDDKSALKFFAKFYPAAAVMQPLLALTSIAASGAALATCPLTSLSQKGHIVAGCTGAFILGWTKLVMVKENDEIVELGKKGQTSPKARRLLESWGPRHNVRTVAGVSALCFLAYTWLQRH